MLISREKRKTQKIPGEGKWTTLKELQDVDAK